MKTYKGSGCMSPSRGNNFFGRLIQDDVIIVSGFEKIAPVY